MEDLVLELRGPISLPFCFMQLSHSLRPPAHCSQWQLLSLLTILLLHWGILRPIGSYAPYHFYDYIITRRSSCTTEPNPWMTGLHSRPRKDYVLFWELWEQTAGRTCRESCRSGTQTLRMCPLSRTQCSSWGLTAKPQAPSVQLTSCSTSSWTASLIGEVQIWRVKC